QFQFTLVIHGAQERNNGFGGFFIQLTTQLVHGHFFYRYVQRGGFAVVEVRGSGADVTQGRYFKDVHIRRVVGYVKTAFVFGVRIRFNQTHFLIHVATQQRAGVASNTTGADEVLHALQFSLGQCLVVTVQEIVETIFGDQGALKGRDGFGDVVVS